MTADEYIQAAVALRKESVDRNRQRHGCGREKQRVALRKESVDRNNRMLDKTILQAMSLSARRAWIEIVNSDYYARLC